MREPLGGARVHRKLGHRSFASMEAVLQDTAPRFLDTRVEACQTRRVGSTCVLRSLEDALEGEEVEVAVVDACDEEES